MLFPEPKEPKFYRTLHSHPSFQNGEALKQLYVLKANGLKASRSTDSFFAPFNHKYLGSTAKNIENSRTILSMYYLFGKQYTDHWIVLRPRDTYVANDDLSVSSQNSIEIHSRDVVFCRVFIFVANTQQRVESKNILNKSLS